jgi:hypothetical protein
LVCAAHDDKEQSGFVFAHAKFIIFPFSGVAFSALHRLFSRLEEYKKVCNTWLGAGVCVINLCGVVMKYLHWVLYTPAGGGRAGNIIKYARVQPKACFNLVLKIYHHSMQCLQPELYRLVI